MSNNKTGRKIIAALEVSVDGFIEGPNGEMDWLATEDEEAWRDIFEMLTHIDTCLLGRGAYPGYQQYWRAILANPEGVSPFTGKVFSKREIDYAHFADKTPHIVLSKTLDQVDWKNTQVVRDVEEIRRLKQRPGKDIYAIGGATLVSGLMNLGLIDEVRLLVNPLILGGGKALFKDVKDRHVLKLVQAKLFKSGRVSLTYVTQPEKM
jgi:dihydrofolate reductase